MYDLDIYDQIFMTTYNINQSYDFHEEPWGTKDIRNRITYRTDMKSTKDRVLTNFWQPARELSFWLFDSRNCERNLESYDELKK